MQAGHRWMYRRFSMLTLKLALKNQCYLHGTVSSLASACLRCFAAVVWAPGLYTTAVVVSDAYNSSLYLVHLFVVACVRGRSNG